MTWIRTMRRFHGILSLFGAFVYLMSLMRFAESQAGVGQGQTPIGAYRIFPKTSFSCVGRPSGYYADIETGCQIYHMCDGLGRQFSYSCPNTTLFQQRMLICDHWYMVNCSGAEKDYSANLLIGQRDKPFVPEDEHMQRTPRPDLLDRPYAPDYSGESFRNQYKDLPPIANQIVETDRNGNVQNEVFLGGLQFPTRWRIRHEKESVRKPTKPIVVLDEDPETNHLTTSNRRIDEPEDSSIDLGTSYSSHYNTSSDISTEQVDNEQSTESNDVLVSSEKRPIKRPSIYYEPPFLYPIYNENYTETTTEEPTTTTTTLAPTTTTTVPTTTTTEPTTTLPPPSTIIRTTFRPTTARSTTAFTTTSTTTTERPLQRPTAFSPRPFSPPIRLPTTTLAPTLPLRPETTQQPTTSTEDPDINDTSAFEGVDLESRTTGDQLKLDDSLFVPNINDIPPLTQVLLPPELPEGQALKADIPKPSLDILPPFPDFPTHDVATTQGPPIYYEWKIPSDALEPPIFDPPISVFGKRVDPDYNNPNKISTSDNDNAESNTTPSLNGHSDSDKDNLALKFLNNPFLSPLLTKGHNSQPQAKSPTPRSIQNGPAHFNIPANDTSKLKKTTTPVPPTPADIQKLQRQYLIPDFLFPLENEGRTGYEHGDTVNSFQLRIPHRRSDDKSWYGENPQCPECHPSYVKPGTCEPCIKRR